MKYLLKLKGFQTSNETFYLLGQKKTMHYLCKKYILTLKGYINQGLPFTSLHLP